MRIGDLARQSGLSRDTIRYYERRGLIASAPEPGGTNTYRNYGADTLEALAWIRQAQAAGLSLDDLVTLMRQLSAADGADFDGIAFLDARIAEVEARLARTRRVRDTLRRTRAALIRAPYPDGAGPGSDGV
ncbi:MerR family transcriptional regulator [Rhodobacteraceae bacterium CCMM004]|nr:MerR family transcriptional regulator [Rhodobacteraceae bacterium CCMM004]